MSNSTLLKLLKTTGNMAKGIKKIVQHFLYLGVSNLSEFKSTYWINAKDSVSTVISNDRKIKSIKMFNACVEVVLWWIAALQ